MLRRGSKMIKVSFANNGVVDRRSFQEYAAYSLESFFRIMWKMKGSCAMICSRTKN